MEIMNNDSVTPARRPRTCVKDDFVVYAKTRVLRWESIGNGYWKPELGERPLCAFVIRADDRESTLVDYFSQPEHAALLGLQPTDLKLLHAPGAWALEGDVLGRARLSASTQLSSALADKHLVITLHRAQDWEQPRLPQ